MEPNCPFCGAEPDHEIRGWACGTTAEQQSPQCKDAELRQRRAAHNPWPECQCPMCGEMADYVSSGCGEHGPKTTFTRCGKQWFVELVTEE